MTYEDELLRRASQLEEEALAEIYDRYSPGLYRYAARLLADRGLAEDCVAETFHRYLNAIQGGRGPQRYLKAYLYRIAHNWITDQYRRPESNLPLEQEWIIIDEEDPSQVYLREQEYDQVRAALFKLTHQQLQVLVLKFLEDWSNDEIAKALEKPVGAVKALQHRGIRALGRYLKEQEQVNP